MARQVRQIKKKLVKKRVLKAAQRRTVAVKLVGIASTPKAEGSLESLDPAIFRERVGLTQSEMARGLGLSERTLLSLEKTGLGKASAATTRRYREFVKLVEAVCEFVKLEAFGRWMRKTNEIFHGSSPLQVIERGDSAWVWSMIHQFRSGEPM